MVPMTKCNKTETGAMYGYEYDTVCMTGTRPLANASGKKTGEFGLPKTRPA